MHVKGHWGIRVKGQTGRVGAQHNKGSAAVQRREGGQEGKTKQRGGEMGARESDREVAGRLGAVFLGIKDLLSGERVEVKREREKVWTRKKGHGCSFLKARVEVTFVLVILICVSRSKPRGQNERLGSQTRPPTWS